MAYVPQKINIDWTLPLRVFDFMNITSQISKAKVLENLKLTGVDNLVILNI